MKTLIAFGTPLFRVLYVSTSKVALFGYSSQYVLNAVYSSSKICTQLCAMVPRAGAPYSLSVSVQLVPATPAIYAALAPRYAADAP